jgi:predicted CXXCH cytochrome family protein
VEALTYIIRDPAEMAAAVLPTVRSKCDVLVLLAHMDEFELGALLPDFPQVDLVVLGHNPRSTPLIEPIQVGTVTAYRATSQGQCLGHLQIALDADGRIVEAKNQVHFLDSSVPDDPEVAAMLDAFDEENRKAQKLVFAKEQFKGGASAEETGVYLGLGTCMGCHTEAFRAYTRTGHARAYRTLAAEEVQRDTRCVPCHVTGYGERGGFSGVRRLNAMVELIDVQCEACHGAGSSHSRDGAYRQAAAKSCVRCHTDEEDPDFNFDKDWPKVAH